MVFSGHYKSCEGEGWMAIIGESCVNPTNEACGTSGKKPDPAGRKQPAVVLFVPEKQL